jgi:hypothetical protein
MPGEAIHPNASKRGTVELVYPPVILACKAMFRVLDVKLDVRGSEHIPATGGAVLACTHVSYLDFIFCGLAALPAKRKTRFMAKQQIFTNRIAGPLMRGMHHISVDRSAGQAESPEGRADVVDVNGPDGFAARLFVDAITHRPLFIAYKTVVPRMHVVRHQAPQGGAAARPEDALRLPEPGQAPPESDARMFVSEFKSVDGVLLPFKISVSVEGGPTEEWQIKKWKLNPALKPEIFKKS